MERTKLLNALKAVAPGVAKGGALLPGADSFIFQDGYIKSYNNHLSVLYPYDTGVEAVVKAAEVIKVMEKMSNVDIKMEIKGNSLDITDGVTTLSMRLIETEAADLIASLALEDLDWLSLPKDFTKALSMCLASVSRNITYGALVGIRVNANDVMSSDNFRATWVTISEAMAPFTIPEGAVVDLLKLPDLEQYAVTNSWVHFMNKDGVVFSSRLIASEFPEDGLKKMFPTTGKDSFSLPNGLGEALDRVGVLTYTQDDGMDYVSLSASKGVLVIKGERQYGSIQEKVKINDGEWPNGVSINIQPKHLIDIMENTKTFQMAGNLVYFHGKKFKHIIATILKG